MKKALRPERRWVLLNNYRSTLLAMAFLLIGFSSMAQVRTGVRQKVSAKGYDVKEQGVDSLFRPPLVRLPLLLRDSGAIAIDLASKKLMFFSNVGVWDTLTGSGSDSTIVPIDSTLKVTAGVLGVDITKLPVGGIGGSDTPFVKASKAGALPGDVTDDRVFIQNSINAASAIGGGIVLLDKPGTYIVGTITTGGITRGLTMAANVSLWIPAGTTLKLKDNSVFNGAPVQLIHIPTTATNVFIGWKNGKGGILDGNTANQPGYTQGFAQTNGNYLIGSANAFNGITIEGLNLIRCFSNSINLGGTNSYGNSRNLLLRNLYIEEFGEGAQIIGTDNVVVENVTHIMNGAIVQGDALELSFCRYFNVTGCVARTTTGLTIGQGGAGIDLYASRFGNVTGFYILGTRYGITAETDFSNTSNNPDQITISNGTIKGVDFASFIFTGGTIFVSNVQAIDNVYTGIQIGKYSVASADYTFNNVHFSGACQLVVTDGVTMRGANIAVYLSGSAPSLLTVGTASFDITGFTGAGGTTNTAVIVAVGGVPSGRIIGMNIPDGMRPVTAGGEYAINPSNLILEGTPPFSTTNGSPEAIMGVNIAASAGTITSANIPLGTKNQIVKILGTYGVSLVDGARIKLNNASTVTLSDPDDFITLQYSSIDSIWRQIGGFILSASEIDPIFSSIDPYIPKTNIGAINLFDSKNYFRSPVFLKSLEFTTRPPVSAGAILGEINGSSFSGDSLSQGFLRLAAGGTTAKSYIDISGYNGDENFKDNIMFATGGAERMRIQNAEALINIPFSYTSARPLSGLNFVYKQHLDSLLIGGGFGDVFLAANNLFTNVNQFPSIRFVNNSDAFLSNNGVFGMHSNNFMYAQGGSGGFVFAGNSARTEQIFLDVAAHEIQFYGNGADRGKFGSTGIFSVNNLAVAGDASPLYANSTGGLVRGGQYRPKAFRRVTALDFTVASSDQTIFYDNNGGGGVVTLPAASSALEGYEFTIRNATVGVLTFADIVYNSETRVNSYLVNIAADKSVTIMCSSSKWYYVMGTGN